MFAAIYELAKTTTLTMVITANAKAGTLTLCVKPTARKGEEAAVTTELTLTATPEEFEQNFPSCLTSYTTTHQSLLEQTTATTAVLEAAKKAQVEKGAKAVTAAAKAPSAKPDGAHPSDGTASTPAALAVEGGKDAGPGTEVKEDPFS